MIGAVSFVSALNRQAANRSIRDVRNAADEQSAALRCVIKAERTTEDLAAARSAFKVILDYVPNKDRATEWRRPYGISYDLMVVALGKTGYGKSTTLNRLLQENVFETSDVGGCTRDLQSVEYRFSESGEEYFCSFADLPGLGEHPKLDEAYFPLYQKTLREAHVVLYFVRADQRDYSVDQRVFDKIIDSDSKKKVILVVNAVDKIEPLNRSLPFSLSPEQKHTLQKKVGDLRRIFALPSSSILAVSGADDYNLDALAKMIVKGLGPSLVLA